MSSRQFRSSPAFALYPGRGGGQAASAYVAEVGAPHRQFWLEPLEAAIFGLLSSSRFLREAEVMSALNPLADSALADRVIAALADLQANGLVISANSEASRYSAAMAETYLRHRPFPQQLCQYMLQKAGVSASSRVLDLAGGPGDLATQLAQSGASVTLADLSGGFLQFARKLARQRGVRLATVHESLNRMVHREDIYDVVTLAQAIHWLDPVYLSQFLKQAVSTRGHVFIVQARFEVNDDHPLSDLFGRASRFGAPRDDSFEAEMTELASRMCQLSEAFEAFGSVRTPLGVQSIAFFRQPRPIDLGFARAFVTPAHLKAIGVHPTAFWRELEARCAHLSHAQLAAGLAWSVVHLKRGVERPSAQIVSAKGLSAYADLPFFTSDADQKEFYQAAE